MRGKSPNWLLGGLIPTTYILGGVAQQLEQYRILEAMECIAGAVNGNVCDLQPNILTSFLEKYPDSDFARSADTPEELYKRVVETYYCRPRFVILESSFFDVTPEDCFLMNYEPMGKVSFGEVAV